MRDDNDFFEGTVCIAGHDVSGGQCRPGVCTAERDSRSGEYFSEVS